MYWKRLIAFLVLLSTSLFSTSSQADSIRYEAFNWTQFISVPACKPLPYGQNSVQIYLDLTTPAKSFRFTGPSGYELSSIFWEYPVVGDAGTTQTLDLGACASGEILLGTAVFNSAGDPAECQGLIAGEAPPGSVHLPIVVGCDDVERTADAACSAAQPTLLSPPDGALDVSLTPTLTWQSSLGEFCVEGIGVFSFGLYVGTSPEIQTYVYTGLPEFTQWQFQDPLLPETTYYWRVQVRDDYWNYVGANTRLSPVHSFTTGTTLAVDDVSWSTFKRVYRE